MKKLFLYPAALYAGKEPTQVITILGSCVAVCLIDSTLKIGGINHFMLPLWNGQGLASPRYGNIAIKKLIEKMEILGSKRTDIKAKVFGGAEVLQSENASFNIGKRNIELAEDALKEYNIPIISSSLGGKYGRKILFQSDTGEVRLKYVGKSNK